MLLPSPVSDPMFLLAVDRHTISHAEEAAVVTPDRIVSHQAMGEESRSLAGWLHKTGVAPGQTIALTIADEYQHLLASVALMRLGCIQVTLPTHEPETHRAAIASRAKVSLVLADKTENSLPAVANLVPDFEYRAGKSVLPPSRPPHKTCIYITSSGTTGLIKITPLSQYQLYYQALSWQWPAQREVFYRPASIEFNNSKKQRLFNLVWATTNVFAKPGRVDFFEICRKFGVTRLNINAVQAKTMIGQAGGQQQTLPPSCHIRLGGAEVPGPLRRSLIDTITPNIHVTYATSEFASIATAGPAHHEHNLTTVGKAHPGITIEIVDSEDNMVSPGTSGRVRVRSRGMATHYYGDESASKAAFANGWFYPGDIGHISRQGLLFLDGRADDMMSLASINIFPAEIEGVVARFPGVVECAAFALKSENWGDIPMIAVVAEDSLNPVELLEFARQNLGLRAPRKIVLVDSLPRKAGTKN
jgi:long-chain acyl-CoA synthetase